MKSLEQRNKEEGIGNVMIILFVLLVVGSFNSVLEPLSMLDSGLLENAVYVLIILSVLLGVEIIASSAF